MSETKQKGKLALYWAASCGGCEIAVLGISEKSSTSPPPSTSSSGRWPSMQKIRDIEKMADGEIDSLPVQRRHPLQRTGIHGPASAPQVEGPRGLRLLRQRGCIRGWPT